MSNSFVRFLPLALSLPALPVYAADPVSTDADQMPVMVITASRTPQPLKDVIGDVTVIDRQTLARYEGESVLNALQVQAGVQIATNGGAGKTSSVFLRGANASQTLVLIDGVRYGSATAGGAALEHIPADQIERVEILRGPAASLYGADAIGGVIQIFTRQGHKTPQAHISVGAGNYGTQQANAGISGQSGETRGSINLSHSKTDGTSAIVDSKAYGYYPDEDGYENNSISAFLSQKINDDHHVGLNILYSEGENHFDSAYYDEVTYEVGQQSYDYKGKSKNYAASIWSDHRWNDLFNTHIMIGQSADKSDSYGPTNLNNINSHVDKYNTLQNQYSVQNNIHLPLGMATFSLERLEQSVDSIQSYTISNRNINSILLGYLLKKPTYSLQANVRNDVYSGYGSKKTYLLGSSIDISNDITVGANISTGFRAPTFNELYWPLTSDFVGNPNLNPETSLNKEIFLSYVFDRVKMRLTGFNNRIKNLLTYQYPTTVNIGQARLQGLTLTSDWQQDALQAGFSYDYLDATDDSGTATDGKQLARRAKNSGLIYAGFHQKDLTSRLEVQAVGKRFDDASNSNRLAGYALLNIASTVTLSPEWQIGVRLNNLLDKEYEQVKGYGTLGFNGLLTFTYTPKL